ncbi:MAG: hypothetical protein LAT83_14275 [Kiritimatiellae bacterium]|nr:hypothetical protein [Kiritimatiellia bacterium]
MKGIERGRRGWPFFLLGGLCLFFLLQDPNPAGHGLDAASPMASWVSVHDTPGRRAAEMVAHPTVANLLAADSDLAERVNESIDHAWLQKFFADELVLIREQAMGPARTSGLVAISRVGWRHAILRLTLELTGPRHLTREGLHLDKTIWKLEREDAQPVWLALAQGHLVLCLHEDPHAIREVLDRLAGFRPRLNPLPSETFEEVMESRRTPDRFLWLGTPGFPHRVHAELEMRPTELAVRCSGPGAEHWAGSASDAHMAFAARLGGPHAIFVAQLPSLPAWGLPSPSLFLLMGPPYFWQVNEFGVPAPLLIFPVQDSEHAEWISEAILDRLRMHTQTDWTREIVDRGWRYLPEAPDAGPGFNGNHPPIALLHGEYLIFSPASNVTHRLLDRLGRPEADFELRDVRWLEAEHVIADFHGAGLPYSSRMRAEAASSGTSTQAKWLSLLGRLTRLSFQIRSTEDGEWVLRMQ